MSTTFRKLVGITLHHVPLHKIQFSLDLFGEILSYNRERKIIINVEQTTSY